MRTIFAIFSVILLSLLAAKASDELILLPPATFDASLPSKLVVFIPGANVPNMNYTQPLAAIQEELAPTTNAYVAILGFKSRKCIQVCPSAGSCVLLHNQVQVRAAASLFLVMVAV